MNLNKLVARTTMMSAAAFVAASAAGAQEQSTMGGPEAAAAMNQSAAATASAPADNAVAEAANPQVVAFVDYQFPSADADSNGQLAASEFTAWISGLKAAELEKAGQTPDPAAVKTYADNALYTADVDKNKVLSKDELVRFFGG